MFRLLRVIIRPSSELIQNYQFTRGPDDDSKESKHVVQKWYSTINFVVFWRYLYIFTISVAYGRYMSLATGFSCIILCFISKPLFRNLGWITAVLHLKVKISYLHEFPFYRREYTSRSGSSAATCIGLLFCYKARYRQQRQCCILDGHFCSHLHGLGSYLEHWKGFTVSFVASKPRPLLADCIPHWHTDRPTDWLQNRGDKRS